MDEDRKQRMIYEIKEWLARYYKEYKGEILSEKDLNRVFGDWCQSNNLKQLI